MLLPRFCVRTFVVGLMVATSYGVCAQTYPSKPIRIVTSGVGGAPDFTARLIAQEITAALGQPVLVDNRGSGVIPGQMVSQAPPDGYSLLVAGAPLWIGPLIEQAPYDPVKDFSAVSLVSKAPMILVVHPALPVKSAKELIALAKARPGALNYAAASAGATTHLSAELFKSMAGVNIVRVPYKSGTSMGADLLSGYVQVSFGNPANMIPHMNSGRLRALAVTSAQPSSLFPQLPTVAAGGLPGYESIQLSGIFAPQKTPATLINRLNQEIKRVLGKTDVKEKFQNSGMETVGSSPEEFAVIVKSEVGKWGKLIKDAGIRAE